MRLEEIRRNTVNVPDRRSPSSRGSRSPGGNLELLDCSLGFRSRLRDDDLLECSSFIYRSGLAVGPPISARNVVGPRTSSAPLENILRSLSLPPHLLPILDLYSSRFHSCVSFIFVAFSLHFSERKCFIKTVSFTISLGQNPIKCLINFRCFRFKVAANGEFFLRVHLRTAG